MSKNIKRKGYIEFSDVHKSDIYAIRERSHGLELITEEGLFYFGESFYPTECRSALFQYSLRMPQYGFLEPPEAACIEVWFKQIVIFQSWWKTIAIKGGRE